ncbi:MAG: hypothetical protein AB8B86_05750 [Pseudomonadales bacterium]
MNQVIASYFSVTDSELMREKISQYKIRVAVHRGDSSAAYELIRAGGDQVSPLENFGLKAAPDYVGWTATRLKEAIDKDYFDLSSAHYDRYFQR